MKKEEEKNFNFKELSDEFIVPFTIGLDANGNLISTNKQLVTSAWMNNNFLNESFMTTELRRIMSLELHSDVLLVKLNEYLFKILVLSHLYCAPFRCIHLHQPHTPYIYIL